MFCNPRQIPLHRTATILLMVVASMLPGASWAVAYCALRDPVSTIYELFPEADNYRSAVGTVGRDVRTAMQQTMPFDLHFNELGRHTLYIAQQGQTPIGMVHARSEPGDWGIDEFVWSISPSLEIRGVKVQRTRDFVLKRDGVESAVQPIIGKNMDALLKLHASTRHDGIAATLLRSAIKTLFVTMQVWEEEVSAMTAHDIASRSTLEVKEIVRIPEVYNDAATATLTSFEMTESPVFERTSVVAYKTLDQGGHRNGLVVFTPLDLHPSGGVWWVVDPEGEIRYVGRVEGELADFASAKGYAPVHPRDCSSAVDLAALEIATLARSQ